MIQQLLMRLAVAINRRRAYAATHPMVVAAEEQLMELLTAALDGRGTLAIGVAHHELLIDGTPIESRNNAARELAVRLHRRGVGALSLEHGVTIDQLRTALTWIAADPDGSAAAAPAQGGVQITRIAYDHLVLDDAIRDAESAVASLWRTLAEVAEFGVTSPIGGGEHASAADLSAISAHSDAAAARQSKFADTTGTDASGYNTDAILASLRDAMHLTPVARRTAVALLDLTNHAVASVPEGRALIGKQLSSMIDRLGSATFGPLIRSLTPQAVQEQFVAQVVDTIPLTAAVNWLNTAATAKGQELSHQMLRLMSKLSTLAIERGDVASDTTFREAAHDLVADWTLADPNPAEHAELLDRIANFERAAGARFASEVTAASSTVESARVVQMALELDFGGEDTVAAAEALIAAGCGRQLMRWIGDAGATATARWLRGVATSDKAVRQLLLTEPVDRLEARAMLDVLDTSSVEMLIDVLAESATRGTRLLVRQRLAEFGETITPQLIARLDDAPWFLVRNILTLLHDAASARGSSEAAAASTIALLSHDQVQVRVEALRRALKDMNERVVVVALQALTDACEAGARLPSHLVTQIMALVDAGEQSDPVRARAVRTLAYARTDAVRDWLVQRVVRRTRILRRLTLLEPTQTSVSALQVLTRLYPADPVVLPVLALAQREKKDARWQVREFASTAEHAT
jgi:hypothetical protein